MEYEFVIKKDGKEIVKEKGETKLEELTKKIDEMIVKLK